MDQKKKKIIIIKIIEKRLHIIKNEKIVHEMICINRQHNCLTVIMKNDFYIIII